MPHGLESLFRFTDQEDNVSGDPSQGVSRLAAMTNFGSPFTPGINPNAPDPRLPVGPMGGGSLLSPILSRLGPIGQGIDRIGSDVAGGARNAALSGTLGALAPRFQQGILQSEENRRQNTLADMQRRLIESRIGLNRSQSESAGDVNSNVQSTFRGQNGNMFLVTRNGEVRDTGVAFDENLQTVTRPDGSVVLVDTTRGTQDRPIEVVSPEEAVAGAAERRGAEQQAATAAQESTKQQFNLPKRIKAADSQIRQIDSVMEEANRAMGLVGPLSTGPVGSLLDNIPGTDAFRLREAIKPIQAALSFDKLQDMRDSSPTGGALGQVSERELDLLGSSLTSLNQAQNPGDVKRSLVKVLTHYNNWKSIIEREKSALQDQSSDAVSGFRIVNANK